MKYMKPLSGPRSSVLFSIACVHLLFESLCIHRPVILIYPAVMVKHYKPMREKERGSLYELKTSIAN